MFADYKDGAGCTRRGSGRTRKPALLAAIKTSRSRHKPSSDSSRRRTRRLFSDGNGDLVEIRWKASGRQLPVVFDAIRGCDVRLRQRRCAEHAIHLASGVSLSPVGDHSRRERNPRCFRTTFDERIAEEELEQVSTYFVATNLWRWLFYDEIEHRLWRERFPCVGRAFRISRHRSWSPVRLRRPSRATRRCVSRCVPR